MPQDRPSLFATDDPREQYAALVWELAEGRLGRTEAVAEASGMTRARLGRLIKSAEFEAHNLERAAARLRSLASAAETAAERDHKLD